MTNTQTSMASIFGFLTAFLCLLSLTPAGVRAEPNPTSFLYARGEQTFYYLDIVNITYKSTYSTPWLHTWCDVDGNSQEKSRNKVTDFNGSALIQLTFKDGGDRCWFQLSPGSESAPGEFNRLMFKYVETERSTDPTNQDGSTLGNSDVSVVSRANSSLMATEYDMEEPKEPTNDVNNSSYPENMMKTHVAIGVGAAVAGITLGAFVTILCVRYRKRTSMVESKLESGGIGGRESPDSFIPPTPKPPTTRTPKRKKRAHRPYRTPETSPIYPDESVSCYNVEAVKTYATDFAMADRQIWTDHLQSRVPEESPASPRNMPWIRDRPRVDSGTTIHETMDYSSDKYYYQ